jgi:cell division transport system ATP-binding protein
MRRSKIPVRPAAMIEFRDVWLRYGPRVTALQGLNLSICSGEFVFVVGQTGSGKSSILKLVSREVRPSEGEVWVDGRDVTRLRPGRVPALRRTLGVVFQDFRLLPERTLWENVAFALRVLGITGPQVRRRTEMALDMVGLEAKARCFPHEVSGGEQQRAAIARAIVNGPQVLLADEPTGNLDPDTSWGIIQLLDKIQRSGTTVLVASHDHYIVDRLKKRVVEIDQGQVVRDELEGSYDLQPDEDDPWGTCPPPADPRLRLLVGEQFS